MKTDYKGVIVEESLENKTVLEKVNIFSTEVEQVTESFKTPWLKQWTIHMVEVPEELAEEVATQIAENIDSKHGHSWYADFKNDKWHYIVFPNRIFKVDRKNDGEYKAPKDYGISLGIPEHQVDFSPDIK